MRVRGSSKYSEEVRMDVFLLSRELNSVQAAARKVGIPEDTVFHWAREAEWWAVWQDQADSMVDRKLAGRWEKIQEKALSRAAEMLEDKSAKISVRDAALVGAISQDKRRVLMSRPNAYKTDGSKHLQELRKALVSESKNKVEH